VEGRGKKKGREQESERKGAGERGERTGERERGKRERGREDPIMDPNINPNALTQCQIRSDCALSCRFPRRPHLVIICCHL